MGGTFSKCSGNFAFECCEKVKGSGEYELEWGKNKDEDKEVPEKDSKASKLK